MENMDILAKLEEYSKAGYVPMHMPGGKRNSEFASTSALDITEIDGFDNMHNAEGIIKNASERAARLYGADKTLMLVNGSTAGILSAVCGATRRKGKIINICSMMSELGRETVSAYAAAKGGLKMLTKNICSEYGQYNIQCNGLGPGYIETPQTAPLRETQPDGSRHPFDQFICAKTPANRWLKPEELTGPAVFLASEASNAVNGHILYVDGGILAYIGKQPE